MPSNVAEGWARRSTLSISITWLSRLDRMRSSKRALKLLDATPEIHLRRWIRSLQRAPRPRGSTLERAVEIARSKRTV